MRYSRPFSFISLQISLFTLENSNAPIYKTERPKLSTSESSLILNGFTYRIRLWYQKKKLESVFSLSVCLIMYLSTTSSTLLWTITWNFYFYLDRLFLELTSSVPIDSNFLRFSEVISDTSGGMEILRHVTWKGYSFHVSDIRQNLTVKFPVWISFERPWQLSVFQDLQRILRSTGPLTNKWFVIKLARTQTIWSPLYYYSQSSSCSLTMHYQMAVPITTITTVSMLSVYEQDTYSIIWQLFPFKYSHITL